jgi:hypothetical protein
MQVRKPQEPSAADEDGGSAMENAMLGNPAPIDFQKIESRAEDRGVMRGGSDED